MGGSRHRPGNLFRPSQGAEHLWYWSQVDRDRGQGSLIAQAQRPSPLDAVIRRRARAGAIDSAQ